MNMNEKNQRKAFSIEEKRQILEKVDRHVGTRLALAKELCIPVSTLNTIVSQRAIVEKKVAECGPMTKKRKHAKKPKFEELENN